MKKEEEQAKSENYDVRKLAQIYEQSPTLIIVTDPEGIIEYVNPKFCEVTGYKKEEVLGKTPRIIQSGETRLEVYKALWKTVKSKHTWKGELLNKKKSGEKYYASVCIFPILDEEGKIINLIGIQEDVSLNKKSEEELKLFGTMAVERELKMVELKKEVNSLLARLGEKEKYL